MARTLDVYLHEERVGILEQDDSGATRFSYLEAWLQAPQAIPISQSLPLKGEAFNRKETRPFFAGLLPEEDSRKMIAKRFGISERNDFSLLERIGAECAGAVSLFGPAEEFSKGAGSYHEISLEELGQKFEQLPTRPLWAGEDGVRLSLAGAQGKLAVMMEDGRYFLPQNGAPSSHILKPQSLYFEDLTENEYYCMRLAHHIGLSVAPVETGVAGGTSFLQVERYDRMLDSNKRRRRLHQEDFCQAMGIPPELKYQQEGGPNLKKCFALLREVSSAPGPDVLALFDAVVFNFLIGNSDAHGKNFSLLRSESGQVRLAPLYDLVCTQAYPGLSVELAMKIGKERKPARIQTRDWEKFFEVAELGKPQAKRRLRDLTSRVQKEVKEMASQGSISEKVSSLINGHCQRLLGMDL
ncbi:type II toxin-antitoxin system HipA family toxin [Roseibacillus persicicus]|uniref:type II toxin-antitoxin system HipA family toxin n=1 Tax=Roseibacillus persicicus TaxID=454148 RepID=UPI00398B6F65